MPVRLKPVLRFLAIVGLMGAIIVATIALVAYGQGYVYDYERGEVVGNGLLLLDSRPRGADIVVDDQVQGKTEGRVRVSSGEHEVSLHRDGYRSWHKQVDVATNEVLSVEYPRLIPDSVTTRPVMSMADIETIAVSHNPTRAAVVDSRNPDRIRLLDAEFAGLPQTIFTLPEAMEAHIGHLQWSPAGSRLLVTAFDQDEQPVEHYVINPQEQRAEHVLGEISGETWGDVTFEDDSTLLGRRGGMLQRLNLEEGTVSPVARGVAAYASAGESVYIATRENGNTVLQRVSESGSTKLHTYTGRKRLDMEAVRRQGTSWLLVHDTDKHQVTLWEDAATNDPSTLTLPRGSAHTYRFSPNRRFLLLHTPQQLHTYDIDQEVLHTLDERATFESHPVWFGNYHVLGVSGGDLYLMEYDGANQAFLTNTDSHFVFGDSREDTIFSLRYNQRLDRLQLQESSLD